MTYKLVDLYTQKVLGTFLTAEKAAQAESHLMHEPGETRYAIEAPAAKTTKTKKARAKKED